MLTVKRLGALLFTLTTLLSILCLPFPSTLLADVQLEDIGAEKINEQQEQEEQGGPFEIKIQGDYTGKTKIRKTCGLNRLQYAIGEVEGSFIYYYDACNREGANVALAYSRSWLDWKSNPYFNEDTFDTVSLRLAAFSQRLCRWTWNAQVGINFDNIEHWDFADYMDYDLLLWGRYAYLDNFGVHIGFVAQTGMKIDRVYPVIGIDWRYGKRWKLNLVFPLDISISYDINNCWNAAIVMRFFNDRHRLEKCQYLSRGLWFYQNSGLEFAINYKAPKWITLNVHAGSTTGGHITIANSEYRHHHRFHLDPTYYAGGQLDIAF